MRIAIAVAALVVLLAGCGGGSSAKLVEAPPPLAKKLMTKRLAAAHLDYKWVACVSVGRTYHHVPITRCNVDFGIDPHVEAYCAVFSDGRLETNFQDRAIPCGHDNAGYQATVVTYGG